MEKGTVFNLLKTEGNFQAKVIKPIAPFTVGMDVNMDLIQNDYVLVTDIKTEKIREEYNLDTHADYDKYFRIY